MHIVKDRFKTFKYDKLSKYWQNKILLYHSLDIDVIAFDFVSPALNSYSSATSKTTITLEEWIIVGAVESLKQSPHKALGPLKSYIILSLHKSQTQQHKIKAFKHWTIVENTNVKILTPNKQHVYFFVTMSRAQWIKNFLCVGKIFFIFLHSIFCQMTDENSCVFQVARF